MITDEAPKIKMSLEEWYNQAVEITLDSEEKFLIIKETLRRIGIPGYKNGAKKLFQTCHIYHKRQQLFIVHFKEMLLIDGKEVNYCEDDRKRRNAIAFLLQEWGLVKIVNPSLIEDRLPPSCVKILQHRDLGEWKLVPKYNIGVTKND